MNKRGYIVFMVLLVLLIVLQEMFGPAPRMTIQEVWQRITG
jgi:hypothetical protein